MTSFALSIIRILGHKALKWAKQKVMRSVAPRGDWLGKYQVERRTTSIAAIQAGYPDKRECRLYIVDKADPRRWRHRESGAEYMPETPVVSDGGSTPWFLRKPVKAWADLEPFGKFKDQFVTHDSGYANAGVWVRRALDYVAPGAGEPPDLNVVYTDWEWLKLTRGQIDALFRDQMTTNGRTGEIFAIWRAVRRFGTPAWREHRRRANSNTASRIVERVPHNRK
jgi:hypothetical protein